MKVIFVTTWDKACGIATYSANLIDALDRQGIEVGVFDKTNLFPDLVRLVKHTDADVIHFQHEFGISLPPEALLSLLGKARSKGVGTVITVHCETDMFNVLIDGVADAVILHNDVQDMAKKNTFSQFYKIPHGIPEVTFSQDRTEYRKKYGIPADAFVIGTCGFIQHRGMENIVMALSDYVKDHKDVYIHLGVSAHSSDRGMSQAIIGSLMQLAKSKGFGDRLIMTHKFMPVEEFRERIYTMDVGFGYAPEGFISNSGMATDIISCGVPIVVNDVQHFAHVAPYSRTVKGDTPEDVAKELINIADNRHLLKDLVGKAKEGVAALGYSGVAKKHIELYEGLDKRGNITKKAKVAVSKEETIKVTCSSQLWEVLLLWPKLQTLVDYGYKLDLLVQNDGLTDISLLRYVCDGIASINYDDFGQKKTERLAKFNSKHLSNRISADVEGTLSKGRSYDDLLPFLPVSEAKLNLGEYAVKRGGMAQNALVINGAVEDVWEHVDDMRKNLDFNKVIIIGTPLQRGDIEKAYGTLQGYSLPVETVIEDVRTKWAICSEAAAVLTAWDDVAVFCLLKGIPASYAVNDWQKGVAAYFAEKVKELCS